MGYDPVWRSIWSSIWTTMRLTTTFTDEKDLSVTLQGDRRSRVHWRCHETMGSGPRRGHFLVCLTVKKRHFQWNADWDCVDIAFKHVLDAVVAVGSRHAFELGALDVECAEYLARVAFFFAGMIRTILIGRWLIALATRALTSVLRMLMRSGYNGMLAASTGCLVQKCNNDEAGPCAARRVARPWIGSPRGTGRRPRVETSTPWGRVARRVARPEPRAEVGGRARPGRSPPRGAGAGSRLVCLSLHVIRAVGTVLRVTV